MRSPDKFAKLLMGIDNEIYFTNIRLHGSMYIQYLHEIDDNIKLHFKEQIVNRDKELIEECKSKIRATILVCGEILPSKVEVVLTGSDLIRIDESLDSLLEEINEDRI